MTHPSRASVGAAISVGILLLAALVGFSQLGGTSTDPRSEVRAAAAVAQAAADLEEGRAGSAGCRRFVVATTSADVDNALAEISAAGVFAEGTPGEDGFYDYLDSERVLSALEAYVPAIAAIAETELLPEDQFAIYTRILTITQNLRTELGGGSGYAAPVSSAEALGQAMGEARTLCRAAG
ncbi:hypothetical protein [Nocardioides sp.]|uniref:hypothetical protein n=1 Tax=Nocardioides sp. TaxID=35761 RepID=UPI00286D56D8|nr:hypothetical protein [Nocardioides sp.]